MRNCWFPIWKAGIFCPGKEIKELRGGVRPPHKQDRRLTPPGRKSTLSGRKLDSAQMLTDGSNIHFKRHSHQHLCKPDSFTRNTHIDTVFPGLPGKFLGWRKW
jgi:hypothetical protein